MFINIKTQQYGLALSDMRRKYPNVSFPNEFTGDYGDFEWYEEVPPPAYNPDTEYLYELEPLNRKQRWTTRNLDPDQMEAIERGKIPTVVTMRQARLALYEVGMLDDINSLIDSLGEAARVEWEYSATVERSNPLINSIGLTSTELDALFLMAGSK